MAVATGDLNAFGSTVDDGVVVAGDLLNLPIGGPLQTAHITEETADLYTIDRPGGVDRFAGADFAYDTSGRLVGGTVTGWEQFEKVYFLKVFPGGVVGPDPDNVEEVKLFSVSGLSVPAATFARWIDTGYVPTAPLLLGGDDSITGNALYGAIYGYAGNDTISEGDKDFWAGELRGGDGNDLIRGGRGRDDINGNSGEDVLYGGGGEDLLHGGRGNDSLNGNGGNDTAYGDLGEDTVSGGQGDDILNGGDGSDWLSGDRGNDTLAGGAGADTFHSFSGAGLDRVTDFNASEGDHVVLDPGTTYKVGQVGPDTVVDLGNGDQVILAGVQLATLPSGWMIAL